LFVNIIKPEEFKSYDKQNQNGEFKNKNIKKQQFRFLELFDQKYNIVIHICGSSTRMARFKEFTERMISINNRTR
jgi:hypothetical protein